jgi:ribosomal protein S18 acetylase RimI-like enzyme
MIPAADKANVDHDYRLTAATPQDTPWLDTLRRSVYRDLFNATWGDWDEERHIRHFTDCISRGHIFIIEVNGIRVGMIQLFDEPGSVEIGEIQVEPEEQNRSVGTTVLTDVIARAHDSGTSVRLKVGLKNKKAYRLYQRLGFQLVERTETHYHMVCEPRSYVESESSVS